MQSGVALLRNCTTCLFLGMLVVFLEAGPERDPCERSDTGSNKQEPLPGHSPPEIDPPDQFLRLRRTGCEWWKHKGEYRTQRVRKRDCAPAGQAALSEACAKRIAARYGKWWSQAESNRRPRHCERRALPTELWPRHPGIWERVMYPCLVSRAREPCMGFLQRRAVAGAGGPRSVFSHAGKGDRAGQLP